MSSSDDDAQTVNDTAVTATPAESTAPVDADTTARDSVADSIRPSRRWLVGRWVERAIAGVVVVAAVASAIWLFLQNHHQKALAAAHTQAQNAACSYAAVLADYNSADLDKYFNAVLAGATGDWKKQFGDTSHDLRDVLMQGQVVSKVGDLQCALKSGDADHADVVVVVGQSLSSVGTRGKPEPGQLSMVLSLTKTNGRWLVDKVGTPLAQQQRQPGQP